MKRKIINHDSIRRVVFVGCIALTMILLPVFGNAQVNEIIDLFGKKKKTENAGSGGEKQEINKEDKAGETNVPVSLDFDYRKNQLVYAKEFLASDVILYELELKYGKYVLTDKTMKKSQKFRMGQKSGNKWEEEYEPKLKNSANYMNIDHGGLSTYYTNYDKGPSAWVGWSDKNKIVSDHGDGKKYTEQQALDYSGYMFFDGIAFYGRYQRYDNGLTYKASAPNEIYVTDKKLSGKLTEEMLVEKLREYLVKGENENDGFIKALSLSLAAEDKAKNSIEGKDVKNIAIKLADGKTKIPVNGTLGFNIEATLADGKLMNTSQGAYWSDYEITIDGGKVSEGGKLEPASSTGEIKFNPSSVKDVITVTVKSKTHNLAPVTVKIPVDYKVNVFKMDYSGSPHGRLAGIAAIIEVKQVKNTVDGSPLLEYRMRYRDDENWHHVVRLSPETQLFFKNDGATKAFKADKNGHPGGVGGDVKLIVDPSVAKYNFEASLRGAPGQQTKVAGYTNGSDGKDGNLTIEKRSVSW